MTATNIDQTTASNIDQTRAQEQGQGKPESELKAAARRHGLTVKEVAALMGVNYAHLCAVANGHRPWTPMLREKVTAILGEVPGQGTVYRQGGLVQGESTGIREQARAQGLTQSELADRVGVSATFMSQVARGRRSMSPQVQSRVEAVLGAPVRIEPAVCANRQGGVVSGATTCIRERARERGLSMGELSDLVGVSRSFMTPGGEGTPEHESAQCSKRITFQHTFPLPRKNQSPPKPPKRAGKKKKQVPASRANNTKKPTPPKGPTPKRIPLTPEAKHERQRT